LLAAVAFLLALCGGGAIIHVIDTHRLSEQRQAAHAIGSSYAHALYRQADRSLSSTLALAIDMLQSYGGITVLVLAPHGVITHVYPLEGREHVIGVDLLNNPHYRTEAWAAIPSTLYRWQAPSPWPAQGRMWSSDVCRCLLSMMMVSGFGALPQLSCSGTRGLLGVDSTMLLLVFPRLSLCSACSLEETGVSRFLAGV
jgi:hypothetical protein